MRAPGCPGPAGSVPAGEDDRGMTDVDHIAVRELPGLHRRAVDGGAVGRTEVVQHRRLAVEVDVDMPAGDRGVRQPEAGVLTTADDVRPALQLVAAARAVVDGQGRDDLLRLRPPARRSSARSSAGTAGPAGVALLRVSAAGVALLVALLVPLLRRRYCWAAGNRRPLRLLAVLLLPLLTLLVPDPLAVAGRVVRLRRVAGVRALVVLAATAGRRSPWSWSGRNRPGRSREVRTAGRRPADPGPSGAAGGRGRNRLAAGSCPLLPLPAVNDVRRRDRRSS